MAVAKIDGLAEGAQTRVAGVAARHERTLMRVARQASLCHDDALDAYQRALEIFVRRVATVAPETELAWLKVVVRHEAIAIRRARTESVTGEELDLDFVPGPDRSVEDQIASTERVRRSAEALRALKPDEATALMMKAHGLSYAEIGERQGWSYTKVNRAVTEGRRRFIDAFEGIESGAECDRYAPIVEGLAGGSATTAQLLAIRPHLRHCGACRAKVRDLRLSRLQRASLFSPIFVLKHDVAALVHRAQASDLATGTGLASAGGGGRIAAVATALGVCLSGATVGTVCVVTGNVPDLGATTSARQTAKAPPRAKAEKREPPASASGPKVAAVAFHSAPHVTPDTNASCEGERQSVPPARGEATVQGRGCPARVRLREPSAGVTTFRPNGVRAARSPGHRACTTQEVQPRRAGVRTVIHRLLRAVLAPLVASFRSSTNGPDPSVAPTPEPTPTETPPRLADLRVMTVEELIAARSSPTSEEVVVRGWLARSSVIFDCNVDPNPHPLVAHCEDFALSLSGARIQVDRGVIDPSVPHVVPMLGADAHSAVPLLPGTAVEVLAVGHLGDHRSATCAFEVQDGCRRQFVIDRVLPAGEPFDGEVPSAVGESERSLRGRRRECRRGRPIRLGGITVVSLGVADAEPLRSIEPSVGDINNGEGAWVICALVAGDADPIARTFLVGHIGWYTLFEVTEEGLVDRTPPAEGVPTPVPPEDPGASWPPKGVMDVPMPERGTGLTPKAGVVDRTGLLLEARSVQAGDPPRPIGTCKLARWPSSRRVAIRSSRTGTAPSVTIDSS